jgi:crossover junction endodeoxyribonuclease RuvC
VIDASARRRMIVTCGCIRPPRTMAFEDRLVVMYQRLRQVLEEHPPEAAAVESAFFGKDAGAAVKLGQARGVLLLALRLAGVQVAHYTPAEVKKTIAGNGQASKQQVQFMTAKLLQLQELPRPLDASDALAIGLCHSFRFTAEGLPQSSGRKPEVDALLSKMIRR